jgi:hypothetical protein
MSNQSQGGTLSMGSLIDVNALPEWLRSSTDTPQSQQGQNVTNGQMDNRFTSSHSTPNYLNPSRPENVRVPNRPRGENGVNEGSEVAANVFSSMLGVASNAPQYPTAPQQQQGQSAYLPGSNKGAPAMPFNPSPMNQGQGAQGYPLNPMNQGQGAQGYQQSYPMNQPPYSQNGSANYSMPYGQGVRPFQQQNQNQPPAQNEKPAKKVGLFEAIRNFFFRQ